jgi:LysR family cyn operon transcriptional activator
VLLLSGDQWERIREHFPEENIPESRRGRKPVPTRAAGARRRVELHSGEVKIGFPPMYGLRYFPPLLAAFHAKYPGITVTAIEGSAGEVSGLLDAGEIDLALLESRRVRDGWEHVAVGGEEIVLCVRRDHALAGQSHVSGKDLDGLPMIMFDETFLQREVFDRRCQKSGVRVHIVVQSNYVPLVLQAASDGLGAATLIRSMVEADGQLVPLSFDPPETFRFNLCWLGDRYLSKANRAFVDFALQQCPGKGDLEFALESRGNVRLTQEIMFVIEERG